MNEQLIECKKEIQENKNTAMANALTQKFQAYPLASKNTSKNLCMFHTYHDSAQLSEQCKENLCCPYNHPIIAQSGRTKCSELSCPSDSLCAVCCHYFFCKFCNNSAINIENNKTTNKNQEATSKQKDKFVSAEKETHKI